MEILDGALDGISWVGYEQTLTTTAKQVAGVRRVQFDHELGLGELTAENDEWAGIKQTIHTAGFEVSASRSRFGVAPMDGWSYPMRSDAGPSGRS